MKPPFLSSRIRGSRRKDQGRTLVSLYMEYLEQRDLPCNTISGFVYHDLNNNGKFEQGEPPLANITLELRNAQNNVVATTVTNAQGFYLFDRDPTIDTAPKSLTRTATYPSTVTDWDMARTVDKFDPTLGALTAVDVAYNGTITSHIKVESLDTAARRVTATVGGTITLTGPSLTPMTANLQAQRFFDAAPFDGTIDFRGPSGLDFGPQSAPGSRSQRLTDAAALTPYSGSGTVSLRAVADATSSASASGNIVSQINTTAEAQVNVTYTYTPSGCLRPGAYTIIQRHPADFIDGKDSRNGEVLPDSFRTDAIQVTLTDRDLPNNNFGELKPSSLHGCVYVDINNNGQLENGEARLPNVAVRLTGTDELGAVDKTMNTGADGCYRFTGLRPGTYIVNETQPADFLDGKDTPGSLGGSVTNDRLFDINLAQGVDGINYNFGELPPSGLGGCVYWDVNDNGVKEDGEQVLPGVKITLTGTDDLGSAVNQTQLTDDKGCYVFHTLRPGTYRLNETQPVGFNSGKNSLGTSGGTIGNDEFSAIQLPPGVAARKYDFAELKPAPVQPPPTPPPAEPAGPGYKQTFSHTRLVVPGPRDVNLLSKLQFLTTSGQSQLDPTTLANVIYVEALYRTLLHRPADLGGLRAWVGQLQAGTSRVGIVEAMWRSPEHRGIQVDNLYATFLRRAADTAGRQAYINLLMNGRTEVDIARSLLNSGEFQAANADNAAFVRTLYSRVLGRPADNAGLQGWTTALGTGYSRAQMVEVFISSREAYGRIVEGVYENYLHRTPEGAGREHWLNALQRGQATPQAFSIAVIASEETFDKARQSART